MGRFVNPDNSAFQVALNSEIYVDKTGLLSYTNKVLDTMPPENPVKSRKRTDKICFPLLTTLAAPSYNKA